MGTTKKIAGAIVAIAFVLTVILTFAFKADVKKNNITVKRVTQWYNVTQITPGSDFSNSNLKISGSEISQPTGEDCNLDNDGNPCSVQLDNTTSATINDNTALTSLPSGVSVEEFAKQPE